MNRPRGGTSTYLVTLLPYIWWLWCVKLPKRGGDKKFPCCTPPYQNWGSAPPGVRRPLFQSRYRKDPLFEGWYRIDPHFQINWSFSLTSFYIHTTIDIGLTFWPEISLTVLFGVEYHPGPYLTSMNDRLAIHYPWSLSKLYTLDQVLTASVLILPPLWPLVRLQYN